MVTFLGRSRNVETLSESGAQRFTLARRQGDGSLPRIVPGKGVRDRAIESDLVILLTALNWATRERTKDGRRLLKENPLHGVRLPREKNPKRPVMLHDVYLRLLEVADQVHPLLEPFHELVRDQIPGNVVLPTQNHRELDTRVGERVEATRAPSPRPGARAPR